MRVTWLIHMCDMTHLYMWHDSLICATWLIHVSDMTHSHVWHDTRHVCDMTYWYVWHDVLICVTWRTQVWHGEWMYLRHDSMINDRAHIHTHKDGWRDRSGVTWRIHMCDMTYSYAWHGACVYTQEWMRGSELCLYCCCLVQGRCVYSTHCNALQHAVTHCTALHRTATHYNALQHTATHCNTLQHTAP